MSGDSTEDAGADPLTNTDADLLEIPMTLEPSSTVTAVDAGEIADSEKTPCTLNTKTLIQHNATHGAYKPLDTVVVRIEVSDTGYGIRKKDIEKGKLFCECNDFL